jgi:hypothetical protein
VRHAAIGEQAPEEFDLGRGYVPPHPAIRLTADPFRVRQVLVRPKARGAVRVFAHFRPFSGGPGENRAGWRPRFLPAGGEKTCKHGFLPAAGSARELTGSRRSLAPMLATKDADLQGIFSGSDGTRTRDLRRDRPVRGSRRWTTMGAESLYSCGFSGYS